MMSTSALVILSLVATLDFGHCQTGETARQMIGRSCFYNSDCPPQATCQKLAPSCNYGACLCPQLHHWDPVKGACRKSTCFVFYFPMTFPTFPCLFLTN